MTRPFFVALLFTIVHAEILDRVAVTVGKHVISEGDILLDLRIAAFLDQKPVDLSGDQKRKTADRLVDQYLLLQEASTSHQVLPTDADARQLLDQVKAQYATETEYRAALARYGVTEEQLSEHLLNGIRALRFTDLRFRPEVQLSDDDLHEYYDSMAAQWRRANPTQVPTFEASRDQIEKLLTDQRVTQALDRWLGTTRSETQILYKESVFKEDAAK
jgi:FKBP-type peptidyl-prolyl cis-trans isomerase (trigger factor)